MEGKKVSDGYISKGNKKVKAFQEISDEIQSNPELKHIKPTVQPKEIEEIEY